jgi:Tol biopolymer transport system component
MMQFTVSLAPAERLAGGAEAQRPLDRAVAISRDGRVLVFAGERKTGTSLERMLFRREIDQPVATPIAGTEGADFPILSPDRASVAFVARDGKLRRVGIDGGTPVDISALDLAAFGGGVVGASWGDDGTIVLGSFIGPLRRVAVSGGATTAITSVESDGSNYSHRLPYQLPDGQGLLYTALADPIGDAGRIYVLPPGGGTPRLVLENAADPRLASGHLLFARTGVVMAVRFDPGALQVAGGPAVVVQDVMQSLGTMQPGANSLAAQFDVSGAGSLVFASGGVYPPANTRLHWFYPGGKSEPIGEGGRELLSPRLSRDGKGIAVAQFGDAKQPLRLYDVDRGLWTSWGDLAGQVAFPVWTPDGQVAFNWFTNGSSGIHMGRPDGTALRQITAGPRPRIPSDVSSDGKWLAFLESFTPTVLDTWVMPVDGSAPPRLLIRASAQTTFSPDGHWIAYSSGMSGVEEIYVEAFPGLGMRRQVSSGGGTNPVWAPDGRTLYYINGPVGGASMMSVPITPGSPLGVGTPRELGPFPFLTSGPSRCYDITPDGRRFVVESYEPPKPAPATGLHVILNWPERLRN